MREKAIKERTSQPGGSGSQHIVMLPAQVKV